MIRARALDFFEKLIFNENIIPDDGEGKGATITLASQVKVSVGRLAVCAQRRGIAKHLNAIVWGVPPCEVMLSTQLVPT